MLNICLSKRAEDIFEATSEGQYQATCFEPDENWTKLWEEKNEKVRVFHAPIKVTKDMIWDILSTVEQMGDEQFLVFHPNPGVIRVLTEYAKIMGGKDWCNPNICIENFPWSQKKTLRTPIDVLQFANYHGYGVCYDFAHVDPDDEPLFRSVKFLRSYLAHVNVVHFSGNRHNKLTKEEWQIWDELFSCYPGAVTGPRAWVLEHKDYQAKLSDGKELARLFQKCMSKFG